MSEQPRRRLRPAPAPRRVGEPNVLSGQATPNRLSTMASSGRGTAPTMGPTGQSPRPAAAAPASVARPSATDPRVEPTTTQRRRLPSFNTLLFVAFLIYTLVRFLTQ